MKKVENLFIERVNFKKVNSACFNARYQVYCKEKKWINPQECTDEKEVDIYDKVSKHIIISNDKWEIQGYARFIFNTNRIGLPVFNHPGLKNKNIISSKSGESSRFIALNKKIRTALTFILLRSLFQIADEAKITNSYIVVEPHFIRYLNRIGFACKPLSGSVEYFGSLTAPVLVDVKATKENFQKMNNDYGNWFLDESMFISKDDFIYNYIYAPATV